MTRRAADRGQSIQIGAVLLFGVLVILLATYQAFVVPDQNRDIESNHVETITQQLQELRNAIVSMPSTHTGRSVTLTLGVQYPSRVVAVNPPTPTGVVRTVGTRPDRVNVTVANAVATDSAVDDYWTGINRSVNSGGLVYRPGYNEYRNPPRITYENSVLRHEFDGSNLTRASQRLVDGRQLTLLALNGTLDLAASDSVSVDLSAVSASSRQISLKNATGSNVTVAVASRHGATWWEQELREDGELVDQGGYVVDVTASAIPDSAFDVVHVELAQNETYTLRMAKVALGTNVVGEDPAYLTDVAGDGRTIQEGSTAQLVLEPRDALNNPVSSVDVHGRVASGSQTGRLANATVTTDEDGRAVFEYEADAIDGTASESVRIDFSYVGTPGGSYDAGAPENASLSVTVENTDGSGVGGGGGGGGPFTLSWQDPSGQTGVTCPGGPDDTCTIDGDQNPSPTLTAGTSPAASGVEVDFSLNDTSVGSLNPGSTSTDGSGEAETTFTVGQSGGVTVFATGGSSGDAAEFEVTGAGSLVYNGDPSASGSEVAFSLTNNHPGDVTFTGFTFNSSSISPDGAIREDGTGDSHEVWIDVDGDGGSEANVEEFGSITEGETVAFDAGGPVGSGETAAVEIYEFRQSSSYNTQNMAGRDVTVAFHYEDDSGERHTLTVSMASIP